MVDETQPDSINRRIAARVHALRMARGLSLEALGAACGVSRSALSLIERGQSSATAVVLDRIAAGLGVPLASLFSEAVARQAALPVSRLAAQPVWQDPASGYRRRSVSPTGFPSPIQIVEVDFPAGARVAFETGPRDRVVHQQIWVLEGRIDFDNGSEGWQLEAGDCLALRLDTPNTFHNPTDRPARYAVVLVGEPAAWT